VTIHNSEGVATLIKPNTWLPRAAAGVAHHWLGIATGMIAATAMLAFFLSSRTEDAVALSNYVAGAASVIALLWLVAGYRLQGAELALQREELKLQRIALEQQAQELSSAAKMSSLGQIQALLEKAEESVRANEFEISKPHELTTLWMGGMEHLKPLLESKDPQVVQSAFYDWTAIDVAVRLYLGYVVTAMKMYIQYNTTHIVDETKDAEMFAYIYQSWVAKAPFLSNHAGVAATLGQMIFMLQPGAKAAYLAGMTASAMLLGKNLFREGALEEMRDELLASGRSLPAICEPWPTFSDDKSARPVRHFRAR
jgi:hypothetical protein